MSDDRLPYEREWPHPLSRLRQWPTWLNQIDIVMWQHLAACWAGP